MFPGSMFQDPKSIATKKSKKENMILGTWNPENAGSRKGKISLWEHMTLQR